MNDFHRVTASTFPEGKARDGFSYAHKYSMKIASCKAKGRTLQNWVRDQFLQCFPHLTGDDCRSTPMGSSGEDIQLSSAARLDIPFIVECKARASLAVYPWLEQHKATHPLVVAKGDRKRPVAIMYFDDFLKLLKASV